VTASDRPYSFSLDNYFNPKNISISQYCFRLGYFITDRIQLSFGVDHMKYAVDQGQWTNITGEIKKSLLYQLLQDQICMYTIDISS
jgi:hypothetical protein